MYITQAFQIGNKKGAGRLETESHQQVEGMPLRTFLFPEQDPANRVAEHADKVVEALEQMATKDFPGLSLDNRVAIVTPPGDFEFRRGLSDALAERLSRTGPKGWARELVGGNRTFCITNAVEASRTLPKLTTSTFTTAKSTAGNPQIERIVVDTIDNFDGLERLIVLCVNLDAELKTTDHDSADNFASRSVIYRAMTRAHMVVAIINRHVPSGYLEFLLAANKDESAAAEDLQEERKKYRDDDEEDEEDEEEKEEQPLWAAQGLQGGRV